MGTGAAAGLLQREPSFLVFRHGARASPTPAALAVGKNWQVRRHIKEVAVTISVSFGGWILDNPLIEEETTRLECTIRTVAK